MKSYTATVIEENGEYIVPLPQELLDEVGWKEGDTLDWREENGAYILTKKEETEWVMVETVQMFRHRYCIEVPKGKSEYALDTVTCGEAKEFSQKHLDEVISSHRVVTLDEALEIFDVDNDYCKSWDKDLKIKNMFTKIGEKYDPLR
jgi:hypothetical protein